ncbi:MAG: tetratricopeptide repeat protein [Planctomycetota bacterium]|nr:tetratricopeptide repeat protein [Planctomycetota bacterium]
MRAVAFLLVLLGATPAPVQESVRAPVSVWVEAIDGEWWCSIRAENAPLERVLRKLTEHMGYELQGLEGARRPAIVNVEVERRPVDQALEFVLGSIGLDYRLRNGVLTVTDRPELKRDALLEAASAAYLKVLTRHPTHRLAPTARLEQGEIADRRGLRGVAVEHYQALIETYPNSAHVPEAYLRSGNLLGEMGRWADAAFQYRRLSNLPGARGYQARARLELARCSVELGDAQSAFYLIQALDTNYPVNDGPERVARKLVYARALIGMDRHLDALRELDRIEIELDPTNAVQALRVRALALQGAGMPGEAARAWLLYGDAVGGDARLDGLERAGLLALEAGDELGALFVYEEAERFGLESRFTHIRDEARSRLGFATGEDPRYRSSAEKTTLAEARVERGRFAEARELMRSIVVARGALEPGLADRVTIVWARCLDGEEGIDPALEFLRKTRAGFDSPDDSAQARRRARLDVAAASLLEDHKLFNRAVDAYGGIY